MSLQKLVKALFTGKLSVKKKLIDLRSGIDLNLNFIFCEEINQAIVLSDKTVSSISSTVIEGGEKSPSDLSRPLLLLSLFDKSKKELFLIPVDINFFYYIVNFA